MKRACLLALALTIGTIAPRAATPTITIDASAAAGKVSPLLYGLMTEEINHAYDGGLYGELVQNRGFLDDKASPAHWSIVQRNTATATIALDPSSPLSEAIPTSLRVDVTQASAGHEAGVANEGYWGIPVRPNTHYRASFFAKSAPEFSGPITVAIECSDGRTVVPSGGSASV
jgi:alpha-N-arabinofuranosidase